MSVGKTKETQMDNKAYLQAYLTTAWLRENTINDKNI